MLAYVGRIHNLKDLKDREASALCTRGLDPKDLKTALFCKSFLRKGEVLAYGGSIRNLKDLEEHWKAASGLILHHTWGLVYVRVRAYFGSLKCPFTDHPLDTHCEPFAL